MTILSDFRLTSQDFTNFTQLQCNGTTPAGSSYPSGRDPWITKVLDPAGSGQYVAKLTVYDTDPDTAGGQRSEYIGPTDAIGTTRWYWWRLYVPSGGWTNDRRWVIMQIHDTPDGGDAGRPPTIMMYTTASGTIEVSNCYDPNATSTSNSYTNRVIMSIPLVKDRWYDFVLHTVWSATAGTGTTELFVDQRLQFAEYSHINCSNDTSGNYFKGGSYDYDHTGSYGSRTVYHQGVVIADAYTTFNQFMAAASSTNTQKERLVIPTGYMCGKVF